MAKFLKLLMCLCITLTLAGCMFKKDKEEDVQPAQEEPVVEEVQGMDSFYETLLDEYGRIDMNNNPKAVKAYGIYNDFFIRCFRNAISRNENEIVSPLSLYYALAILSNGASGESKVQLENTLGMSVSDLNHFLKDLDTYYDGSVEKIFQKANALWFNTAKGLSLKKEFKDTVKEYYGAAVEEADFKNATGLADKANAWAKENTNGAIDGLIEDSDFDEDTMFLILNALATGDEWIFNFGSENTYNQKFVNYDKSESNVKMMHQKLEGYWHLDNCEGVVKMLTNGIRFVAIMPKEGVDIYDFINLLDEKTISSFISSVVDYENMKNSDTGCSTDLHITRLSLPRFSYDKGYELRDALTKMGIGELFSYESCDFSAMADGDQKIVDLLEVKDVKQRCSIEVNEEEVIASAATVIMGGLGGGGCDVNEYIYHDVVFDRPFLYFLTAGSRECVLPLFAGIVTKLENVEEETGMIENITGKINIRSKPSKSGEKVGTFAKGEVYEYFEKQVNEGYTWYRIGENKWVADEGGKWIKEVSASDVSKTNKIENIIGKINIRSKPSKSSDKVGTFAKGEVYEYFEMQVNEGYTWYRIGENKWVADEGGKWIKEINSISMKKQIENITG